MQLETKYSMCLCVGQLLAVQISIYRHKNKSAVFHNLNTSHTPHRHSSHHLFAPAHTQLLFPYSPFNQSTARRGLGAITTGLIVLVICFKWTFSLCNICIYLAH